MKKIILTLTVFFILFETGVSYGKVITYKPAKVKEIANAIAKKAGVKVVFIGKIPTGYCNTMNYTINNTLGQREQRAFYLRQKYACTLYNYTNWYKQLLLRYFKQGDLTRPAQLNYKHVLINFLNTVYGNTYGKPGPGQDYKIYIKNGVYYAQVKTPKPEPKTKQISTYAEALNLFKTADFINKAGGGKYTAKTFGLSGTGLQQIVFNVTDPSYYKSDVSAISQAYSTRDKVTIFGNGGTPQQYVAEWSNMDNQATEIISNNISAFNAVTSSKQALYGAVDNYYANALQSTYGSLKTSFLSNIGITAGLDVSYLTILRRANIFLTRINDNKIARQRFGRLLNSEFQKLATKSNYIPSFTVTNPMAMNFMQGIGGRITPINPKMIGYLGGITTYPDINLKSVNFFSLTYFLLHDAYYGRGKVQRNAERLLKYITLSQYNRANKLFYKNMPAQSGADLSFIQTFLYALKSGNIAQAKAVRDAVTRNYRTWVEKNRKTGQFCSNMRRRPRAYFLMQILILHEKNINNSTPWAKLSKSSNSDKIDALWSTYEDWNTGHTQESFLQTNNEFNGNHKWDCGFYKYYPY